MNINETLVAKILETVDAGLIQGMGVAIPGVMCVEAAVCFALGLPHSDNPPCVGGKVRSYKIALNDLKWSSTSARALGMREVAIAQLGSNNIDQNEFMSRVFEENVKQLLPIGLRSLKEIVSEEKSQIALEKAAIECETKRTLLALDHLNCVLLPEITEFEKDSWVTEGLYRLVKALITAHALSTSTEVEGDTYLLGAFKAGACLEHIANLTSLRRPKFPNLVEVLETNSRLYAKAAKIVVEVLKELNCEGTKFLWMCNKENDAT